jgi:hypothetical protein
MLLYGKEARSAERVVFPTLLVTHPLHYDELFGGGGAIFYVLG